MRIVAMWSWGCRKETISFKPTNPYYRTSYALVSKQEPVFEGD